MTKEQESAIRFSNSGGVTTYFTYTCYPGDEDEKPRVEYHIKSGDNLVKVPIEVFYDYLSTLGFDGTLEDIKAAEKVQLFLSRVQLGKVSFSLVGE